MNPDPRKEILSARFLKDNPDYRKSLIALFAEEKEKGPGPGGGGVFPKNHKPLCITDPILWQNGYMAKSVDGDCIFARPFEQVLTVYPTISKEYYIKKRQKYLLDN